MFHGDMRAAKAEMDTRVQEALRRTESRRLLRQAGIERRAWFARQTCWILCQLGRLLVGRGRRLEQVAAPPTLCVGSSSK